MRNRVVITIIAFISLVLMIRYFTMSYSITYKLDDYIINEYYKKGNMYFEIKDDDVVYNFDISMNRKLGKKLINRIETISSSDETCIYPTIKGKKTYPLCSENGEVSSYYLMESEDIVSFINSLNINEGNTKTLDTFKFYNNLNDDEYIAVYKYNGFYVLNGDKIKSINLFENDRYDNSLCTMVDSYILLPEEAEYEFKRFILIDLKSNKHSFIDNNYDISFDSIFLGNIKNKVYLLDNKNSKEYEIDLKKKEVKLIGDYETGFKVYKNGKLKTGMLSELKDRAGFGNIEKESIYSYKVIDDKLYKIYNQNEDIKTLIYNGNVDIISINKNELFFIDNDTIYKYNPISGIKIVLINEEMNYNKTNFIYIYINN